MRPIERRDPARHCNHNPPKSPRAISYDAGIPRFSQSASEASFYRGTSTGGAAIRHPRRVLGWLEVLETWSRFARISTFFHPVAALAVDRKIVAAFQEERLTRKKLELRSSSALQLHDLDYAGVSADRGLFPVRMNCERRGPTLR